MLLGTSVGLIGLSSLMISCSNNGSDIATQPAAQSSPVQSQTVSEQATLKQLRVVFPSRTGSTEVQRKADAIAKLLSNELKMPVEAIVADDTAAVEALKSNRAEVAFLSSRPALKAEKLAGAKLYLAEVRDDYSGGHTYRSVFVVRNDSELQKKGDSKENLEQLKGKKMSFTSPTSGSGFIFPVGELVKQGLVPDRDRLKGFFSQVSYGGNYGGALQAVLRGQADVAAVSEYALKAPYVTEEEGKRLRVLHEISGVPAHGVAIDDRVPESMRVQVIAALQKLNEPANNALLKELYNSDQLIKVEHDSHLAPVKEALQKVGME
ncbi:MAG: phosphate/phosphite/phosphonate ABC transporter substrate-binding protein [Phormidesmis sp. CAN_BIN44]|nr:phosphate/phosphite/phosphonate ABC transporter substrate-binding protein [Phormidesmis sp. CAN_BIN44]